MTFWLGIDGGGSTCRAAVADANGVILGKGEAGPANIASDPERARENILDAARKAMGEAFDINLAPAHLSDLIVGMGLAGANSAGVAGVAMDGLPFRRMRIESDVFTAVKGALQANDGIVAALGTGSFFARQSGGTIRQIGGWGLGLGDHGSGAWIGREMLTSAVRCADGFDEVGELTASLLDQYDGKDGIIRFSLTARPSDYAQLAPIVVASDDDAALQVMARAATDVAASIDLLQKSGPLPVTFIGGLASTYAAQLGERWACRAPLGNALDGALFLARSV